MQVQVQVVAEGEDERAVQAAQQEATTGVNRECALLPSRLSLLATHALVRTHPLQPLLPDVPYCSVLLKHLQLCHFARGRSHSVSLCAAFCCELLRCCGTASSPQLKGPGLHGLQSVPQGEVQLML